MTANRQILATLVALALGSSLAACAGSDEPAARPESTVTQQGSSSTDDGNGSSQSGTNSGTDEGGDGTPTVSSVVAAELEQPIAMIPRPGDDEHVWVAEREGRIRLLELVDGGTALEAAGSEEVLLDLTDDTTTDGERGLLGITFSPEGDELFVSYTDDDGNSRVVSYDVVGDLDDPVIDQQSEQLRFAVDQPYPNHNGGDIAFGPDGLLWMGLGDGGLADDPDNRAQDPSTPLGKFIRLDVLGEDGEPEPEIVVSGVRNPWRWNFDEDGSLWIADVGQNAIEEVDRLPAGEIDGANLGWSGFEGTEPYLEGEGRRPGGAIPPVFQYRHTDGNCSITGGFVYRGEGIPSLQGAYLFADYCAGHIRALRLDDDGVFAAEYDLGVEVENPISFGTDAAGEAYVLSQAGDVVRLTDAG